MKTMKDLFIHELYDLKSASESFHSILKRMGSSATNRKLLAMLDVYYYQTEYQQKKLAEYLSKEEQEEEPACIAAEAIAEHGLAAMKYTGSTCIRDIALLIPASRMKHFNHTAIGTLLCHAHLLKLEKEIDLLTSLKKKISEEEEKPLEIAQEVLHELEDADEAKKLLGDLILTQHEEEKTLVYWLPKAIEEAASETLCEALSTYLEEHKEILARTKAFFSDREPLPKWDVLQGTIKEWKEHLSLISSPDLKDIALIFSVQRGQHQNIALYEYSHLLSKQLGDPDKQAFFRECCDIETGNDESFSAIAEGSLFDKGLNAKIKQ